MYKTVLITLVMLFMASKFFSHAVSQELPEDDTDLQHQISETMTNERLQGIIRKLDPEFTGSPGHWQLLINEIPVRVVTDANADRMRIIVPIRKAEALSPEEMYRILQANYDSALDARYAIGQGILWATFVHPLSSLTDRDFISGLGQTINILLTYGKTYSSGIMSYGGGDSGEIIERQLIEELMKRGNLI